MSHTEFQIDDHIRTFVSRATSDPNLNTCVVGHRRLYDEGCVQLFTWLSTGTKSDTTSPTPVWTYETRENEDARPFPRSLDSLELSDVQMGDVGFQAAVSWLLTLRDPVYPLTKLNLRANEIRGDAELAKKFISACPRLESLVLSNNPLSLDFRRTLLSLLSELPCLSKLYLSMTGLDLEDARALAACMDRGCKLVDLYASSNNMGYKGVRAIVRSLQHCWTIQNLELYSNNNDNDEDDQDDSESEGDWGHGLGEREGRIMTLLSRNYVFKRQTAREALTLLKYSRIMLQLQPSPPPKTASSCYDCDCIPKAHQATAHPPSQSPFHALPVEVQLSILSELASTLSAQQRLRVFTFATDFSTLPSLRLCLPASKSSEAQCLPDPASLTFPNAATGKKFGSLRRDTATTNTHTCGDGNCMGNKSVLCKRETDRKKWLEQVGCDFYDPGPRK